MVTTITRDEINAALDAGAAITLVETLRPEHFDQGHLPGAVHLHHEDVEHRATHLKLATLGYTNVRRYEAGKQDWAEAGLPLERGAVPTI